MTNIQIKNTTNCFEDLSLQDAWNMLKNDPRSYLIDVRRTDEWENIGYPDLSTIGKNIIKLSYNEIFADKLAELIPEKSSPLIFICAIGGRSARAAELLTQYGYINCYNLVGGFVGIPGKDIAGWKDSNLPWARG
jgi:rhodanese-related sulfurtransferase